MSDIETAAFKEAQESLKKASILAASTAKSSKPKASSIGEAKSTRIETIETPSGGGDGNGSGSHGGGGGGASNQHPDFWNWKSARTMFFIVCSALVGLSVAYLSVARTTDKGIGLQTEEQKSIQLKHEAEIAKAVAATVVASGAIPPGWTYSGAPANTVSPTSINHDTRSKESVVVEPFACGSDVDVAKAFTEAPISHLNAGSQVLRVGFGCLVLQVNGKLTKLEGGNLLIATINEDKVLPTTGRPGFSFKCGNFDGATDKERGCNMLNFLNLYAGYPIDIANRSEVASFE